MKKLLAGLGPILARYVKLLAAWMVLFSLFRLILVVATWPLHGNATPGLLLGSFIHGLLFDLSLGVKVAAPFALWQIWRPAPARMERRFVLALFGLVAFVGIFALTAEVEYYKEFQVRLGPLALEYFGKADDNKTVAGMIWHGYPVVRWMLVCFVIWGLFVWLGKRLLTKPGSPNRWSVGVAATVILVVVTVVGWRGGFRGSPLRWGDSVFSQNTYANHMAQNGVFSLIDTVLHTRRGKEASAWGKSMPLDTAIKIAREVIVRPDETITGGTTYPLLRRSPPSKLPLNRVPKNVVVVVMESFSARFCGATGSSYGVTPNYDEIARQGILFDRAFSMSTHTAQGIFGTLCSFPNLPDYDGLMKQPLGTQKFCTLPSMLRENGFNTLFLYNGLFSWDNKEGFFRGNGVERFIGRNDYPNPVFVDPDWGVSDLDVFMRANEEFTAFHKQGKRFLGLVLTLSNHAPFNLPKPAGLNWVEGGGDQNQRINGVHYADWALGQFMAAARQTEWFKDTLFVFTGDHGFGIAPLITEAGLLHQHVPILFYGPEIFGDRHEVRHQVISQLDIEPTVLGLLGLNSPHQCFGRDIFSLSPEDPGHAYVKAAGSSTVGWIEGDKIAVAVPGKPMVLQKYDLSFPPSASDDLSPSEPERLKEMEQHLRGVVVTALDLLQNHHCAPK